MADLNEMRTTAPALNDGLEADLEFEMYDDDVLFDDDLDAESDTDSVDDADNDGPSRASISLGWRRVDLLREEKLLRMALADFDDYDADFDTDFDADFDFVENNSSAYAH